MTTTTTLFAVITLPLALTTLAAALAWARRRLPATDNQLINSVDALLPQTQCAQCGYPGCRPYAQAVVKGEAAINLCPPGGNETFSALRDLLHVDAALPPQPATAALAVIDEPECIGCFLCVRACPVDAIVGAPQLLHTVIAADCTGCELCVPVCPVDCISMTDTASVTATPITLIGMANLTSANSPTDNNRPNKTHTPTACISCGNCVPVCPRHLHPEELLRHTRRASFAAAHSLGLSDCVECRLCDNVCPSDIQLAAEFGQAKQISAAIDATAAARDRAKTAFDERNARMADTTRDTDGRRAERLSDNRRRAW